MDGKMNPNDDRTEQLLNFQSIVGIEDLERCRQLLERANWDLSRAVLEHFGEADPRTPAPPQEEPSFNLRRRVPSAPPPPPTAGPVSERPPQVSIRPSSHVIYEGEAAPISTFDLIKAWITLPFKFVFTSLLDIFRFVLSLFYGPVFSHTTPLEDVQNFIDEFEKNHGTQHPVFYRGAYKDAYNSAKKDLKFLLLYLHQDKQIDSERLCSDTLTNLDVISLINSKALFWGCSTKYAEGHKVAQALQTSRFPAIGLIALKSGQMTLVGRLQGYHTPEELTSRLQQLFSSNERHLTTARDEKRQLEVNQSLRREQDDAYQKSLRADQEKEQKKQEEIRRKASEERRVKEKEERIQREKEEKEANTKRRREQALASLPAEPEPTETEVCRTGIKLPNNRRLERRFHSKNTVADLYNWVASQEDSPKAFEIYTSHPRKPVENRPGTTVTLDSLGLGKAALFLVAEIEESDDELELSNPILTSP